IAQSHSRVFRHRTGTDTSDFLPDTRCMATRLLALSALIFVLTFSGPGFAMNLSGAAARTLYISPSGSDANACTVAAPCRTFNRAYRAAAPGDSVQIGAGTYPAQTIA